MKLYEDLLVRAQSLFKAITEELTYEDIAAPESELSYAVTHGKRVYFVLAGAVDGFLAVYLLGRNGEDLYYVKNYPVSILNKLKEYGISP